MNAAFQYLEPCCTPPYGPKQYRTSFPKHLFSFAQSLLNVLIIACTNIIFQCVGYTNQLLEQKVQVRHENIRIVCPIKKDEAVSFYELNNFTRPVGLVLEAREVTGKEIEHRAFFGYWWGKLGWSLSPMLYELCHAGEDSSSERSC